MAVIITEDCISCNACQAECPNNAIYGAGETYNYGGEEKDTLNDEHTYIVPEKCTECVGFYDEPQCIAACPTEAIIHDENNQETQEELMAKKEKLDEIGR